MGWPKGKKRVPRETIRPQSGVSLVEWNHESPDLVLTLRRLTTGSFTGLWELCRIEPDGTRKVLTDANTKQIVSNLARNEIVRCGT